MPEFLELGLFVSGIQNGYYSTVVTRNKRQKVYYRDRDTPGLCNRGKIRHLKANPLKRDHAPSDLSPSLLPFWLCSVV